MNRTPTPMAFIPTTIVLLLSGFGGLLWMVTQTVPTLGPRWLFFFSIVLSVTGLLLPATAYLNYRFPSTPPIRSSTIVRQAMWFGIYSSILAWFQYGRVFNFSLALIFLIAFVVIEGLLILWERTRWRSG